MRTTNNLFYAGIDNGVSGSVGMVGVSLYEYFPVPIFKEQDYTKKKQGLSRIKGKALLRQLRAFHYRKENRQIRMCFIERPMINPTRFRASCSALRSLEATLIVLEMMNVPKQFIDSKEWQKEMLPKGVSGPDLKSASVDIGIRLFPECRQAILKQRDADGLLIAEYCRRMMR